MAAPRDRYDVPQREPLYLVSERRDRIPITVQVKRSGDAGIVEALHSLDHDVQTHPLRHGTMVHQPRLQTLGWSELWYQVLICRIEDDPEPVGRHTVDRCGASMRLVHGENEVATPRSPALLRAEQHDRQTGPPTRAELALEQLRHRVAQVENDASA